MEITVQEMVRGEDESEPVRKFAGDGRLQDANRCAECAGPAEDQLTRQGMAGTGLIASWNAASSW
jgi:hypothetical protein